MIAPSPYSWHERPEPLACPIPCCTVRLFFDELGEHVRVRHPEPPMPAEIIVLANHARR